MEDVTENPEVSVSSDTVIENVLTEADSIEANVLQPLTTSICKPMSVISNDCNVSNKSEMQESPLACSDDGITAGGKAQLTETGNLQIEIKGKPQKFQQTAAKPVKKQPRKCNRKRGLKDEKLPEISDSDVKSEG